MVRGIGPLLRLEADSMPFIITGTALADVLFDELAGIDLQSVHSSPALHREVGGLQRACVFELRCLGCAVGKLKAPVEVEGLRADEAWLPEIEVRSFDGCYLAGRAEVLVERRVVVREDLQAMVIDRPATLSIEVEISVIGECNNRRGVGCRLVVKAENRFVERVGDIDVEVAGKAFFAVRGAVMERDTGVRMVDDFPYLGIKTFFASMQHDRAVGSPNTIRHSSAYSIEIGLLCTPFVGCAEAKDEVSGCAVWAFGCLGVWEFEANNLRAERGYLGGHAVRAANLICKIISWHLRGRYRVQ